VKHLGSERRGWCGGEPWFSNSEYARCSESVRWSRKYGYPGRQLEVVDDEVVFYRKQYWLDRQSRDLGFPKYLQKNVDFA
jgi:hypothetical protein